MVTTQSTEYASTVQRKSIPQGSRLWYLISCISLYLVALSVFLLGIQISCLLLLELGVNALLLRVSTLPLLVVFFSLICKEISRIVTTEYYVEDGVLKGPKVYIDLWNIEDVRYGSRCIFLNGVMLGYIANPKMFLDELDVIYTALTGEPLP